MKYTVEFKQTVEFAKEKNLFLGYGNPNGKILMIGKEHYFKHNYEKNTEKFYDEIIRARNNENTNNILSWDSNIKEKYQFDWNSKINGFLDSSNALTAWWNQRNLQNRQLKNGQWNEGTSNTYFNYQKIYQNVFLNGEKQTHINFQKECFITELNDVPSGRSYNFPKLKELREESINNRKKLFNKSFFKSFPVVIIASGHYPRDYNFDIENIFEVDYIGKPIVVENSWYNLHYSKDKKRLVIHTRQLSTSVSNKLIEDLSNKVKDFFE